MVTMTVAMGTTGMSEQQLGVAAAGCWGRDSIAAAVCAAGRMSVFQLSGCDSASHCGHKQLAYAVADACGASVTLLYFVWHVVPSLLHGFWCWGVGVGSGACKYYVLL
jgi:hypothetical protein